MPRIEGYKDIGSYKETNSRNNVIAFMQEHMKRFPKKDALLWTTKQDLAEWDNQYASKIRHSSINFEDFYSKIQKMAMGLKELGIKKGDCVIIFLPMSVQLYQSMFAVLQNGAVAVFLDSWARRTHLGASADTVSPKAMISFSQAFEFCKEVPEIDQIPIKIEAFGPATNASTCILELESKGSLDELCAVRPDDTALITFTTGSSGRPKGVNRTHEFLAAQHFALDECIPYTSQDKDLPAFPIFSLNNLASGVTTIIPAVDIGSPKPEDPLILATQLKSCEGTCTTLSPSMLVEMAAYCENGGIQLEQIRRVVTGGAPITNQNLKDFLKISTQSEIWVLYGSTEVEPIAHIEAQEILAEENSSQDQGVNVGEFAEGLEYKFVKIHKGPIDLQNSDWSDWEVEPGEVGEICVAGAHVCKSYYNYPEATKATKIVDKQSKVWHRTGDLGRLDQNWKLWLVGRVHNAIQRDGQWLFPVQAEILLKQHAFVKRAAYLGVPDKKLGEKTYAVISLKSEFSQDSESNFQKQIESTLRSRDFPVDGVFLMQDIPMDPRHHSKVEYSVLRQQILDLEKDRQRA